MDPSHARSRAVPPRLGFTHEATLPRRFPRDGRLGDVLVWSLYAEQVDRLADPPGAPALRAWDVLDRRLV